MYLDHLNNKKMKKSILNFASKAFVVISALSLLSVSLMAFYSPQMVMDLVQVNLNNNDALSSIRGVYGGVGFTVIITLIYLLVKDINKALLFLTLFWGAYAISRILTIIIDGKLGAFGNQWLVIEIVFFVIALTLSFSNSKKGQNKFA